MNALRQAFQDLESASRGALGSLKAGQDLALDRFMQARADAFSRLRIAVLEAQPGPEESAVLDRVLALDRELRLRAVEVQESIRDERIELARSLRAARSMVSGASAGNSEPRFIARHA